MKSEVREGCSEILTFDRNARHYMHNKALVCLARRSPASTPQAAAVAHGAPGPGVGQYFPGLRP